ncbi:hypothetical protein GY45DRAFT_298851 [Cubamyces sp. BRFM 1775]|nr:hypothetical protein GY45DRAFT_298851 [Cubamyces sp. BRFM 1775]
MSEDAKFRLIQQMMEQNSNAASRASQLSRSHRPTGPDHRAQWVTDGHYRPEQRVGGPLVQRFVDAWPGIYKWSVFIFSTRIDGLERTNTRRQAALDVRSVIWYTVESRDSSRGQNSCDGRNRNAEEDSGPIPPTMDSLAETCVLGNLLKFANREALDRRALKGPAYNDTHITIYMDFINSISRVPSHSLRHALLSAKVIWVVTNISDLVHTPPDPAILDAMLSGFGYPRNCL